VELGKKFGLQNPEGEFKDGLLFHRNEASQLVKGSRQEMMESRKVLRCLCG